MSLADSDASSKDEFNKQAQTVIAFAAQTSHVIDRVIDTIVEPLVASDPAQYKDLEDSFRDNKQQLTRALAAHLENEKNNAPDLMGDLDRADDTFDLIGKKIDQLADDAREIGVSDEEIKNIQSDYNEIRSGFDNYEIEIEFRDALADNQPSSPSGPSWNTPGGSAFA